MTTAIRQGERTREGDLDVLINTDKTQDEFNSVECVEYLRFAGVGKGYVTFYDDGDNEATYAHTDIPDLIEALTFIQQHHDRLNAMEKDS